MVEPPSRAKDDLVYDETVRFGTGITSRMLRYRIITGVWSMNLLPVSRVDTEKKVLYTKVPGNLSDVGVHRHTGQSGRSGPADLGATGENNLVENTLDGLREKGNWAVNTRTKKLYLWPATDTDQIYAPCLKELVRVEGAIDYWGPENVPVKYIRFQGITFTGGDRDVLQPDDSGIQHDWEINRTAQCSGSAALKTARWTVAGLLKAAEPAFASICTANTTPCANAFSICSACPGYSSAVTGQAPKT